MDIEKGFYADFVERFIRVAKNRKDIRAAFIIGSRARRKNPADQLSDLDILIYTDTPQYYLETAGFLAQFGLIWSSFATMTLGNDPERLTLFDGGYQVDLVVKTVQEYEKQIASNQVPWLFKRGVQLLVDNNGDAQQLLPTEEILPEKMPLTEETFIQVNQMFWFMTLYISKQLIREENWAVKAREMDYKNLILQMIEWYEQSLHGSDYDTWHGGKFIKEWSEEDIYQELFGIFAGFDIEGNWQALERSMRLFSELTAKIQTIQKFNLPDDLAQNVTTWIEKNRAV